MGGPRAASRRDLALGVSDAVRRDRRQEDRVRKVVAEDSRPRVYRTRLSQDPRAQENPAERLAIPFERVLVRGAAVDVLPGRSWDAITRGGLIVVERHQRAHGAAPIAPGSIIVAIYASTRTTDSVTKKP